MPCDIVVCIKQVPHPDYLGRITLDRSTGRVSREGVPAVINPGDRNAIEEALRIREQLSGRVTVLTMGPPQADKALTEALAMGADDAIHLCDLAFAGADTLSTAQTLAYAIRKLEHFDLVLCGNTTIDSGTGQVAVQLAEFLGLPCITDAEELTFESEKSPPPLKLLRASLLVRRVWEQGYIKIRVKLPAVIAVTEKINQPRLATVFGIMAAAQKEIKQWHSSDIGAEVSRVGLAGSPTQFFEISEFHARRQGEVLRGPADEVVALSVERLVKREANMTTAKHGVWVWVEHYRDELALVSLGLLGKAREIGQQLGDGEVAAVLAGTDSRKLVAELIDHGADKVYLADNPRLSSFEPELCADFMTGLIQEHQPEIVLWGATSLEREIAARVAAKLGTGLTAHCMDLYIGQVKGEQQLVAVVAGWGGNLALKIICPRKRPQMATAKPGIFLPPKPQKRRGEVIEVKVADRPSRLEIAEVVEKQEKAASLEQAETVVVGGWGLNSIDGFAAAKELAQVLGGTTGGTRPALDAGWITTERMVGQSGTTIAPRLLVTLGVSGAAQFATGVLRSGFILAIDKNPNAPIFEMADLGIVGDLGEVLPLLISKIKAIKEKA